MTEPRLRKEDPAALDRRYRALRLPCPAHRRAALRAALERQGQQQPVLATDGVEPGRLVLVDGFKRVELLAELGAPVLVSVATLDAPSALGLLVAANAGRTDLSKLEEAWVIDALQREHGLDQAGVAALLGWHGSTVCRRLQLLTALERQVQDDVRLGLISAAVARELARLPRGNQAATARAVVAHDLSSRQAGRLVTVLRTVDAKERRAVLDDPLAHLPAPGRPRAELGRSDPRLGEQANRVRLELLRVQSATNRLDELCHERRALSPQDVVAVAELAARVLPRAAAILAAARDALVPAQEAARAS
jgi:ParB-like chromosome segregation protein Spo0J